MIRKTIKGGDFKSQMVGELVFDQVPEEGSFNPVTSDAVVKAIDEAKEDMQEKIDEVTLDPSAVALGNVHLLDEVTSFAADAKILVDSETNGPGAMPKDALLLLTAQNALAGNLATAFDPTRTSENPYKAGESVVYEGKTYTFKVEHYGPWSAADVFESDGWSMFCSKIVRYSRNFDLTHRIIFPDGHDVDNNDYDSYKFVPVHEGDIVTISANIGSGFYALNTFNSSKEVVGNFFTDGVYQNVKYTIPSGVAYISCQGRNSNWGITILLQVSVETSEVDAYKNLRSLEDNVSNLEDSVEELEDDVQAVNDRFDSLAIKFSLIGNANLNKYEALGRVVNVTNGNVGDVSASYPNAKTTKKIRVNPGSEIFVSGFASQYIGFAGYDSSGTYVCDLVSSHDASLNKVAEGAFKDLKITVPQNVYFIAGCTRDYTLYELSTYIVIDKMPKMVFTPVYSSQFFVDVYQDETKFLRHQFVKQQYSKSCTSEDGQITETIECADNWRHNEIYDFAGTDSARNIMQGNSNFIYNVDSKGAREQAYIGPGHGGCIADFYHFFVDGESIAYDGTQNIVFCEKFSFAQKLNCYAPDTENQGYTSEQATLLLDNEGNKILTAVNYLEWSIVPGNNIEIRNKLVIKRDGISFYLANGAMLEVRSPYFDKVIQDTLEVTKNTFEFSEGSWDIQAVDGSSINLGTKLNNRVSHVVAWGNDYKVEQAMDHIDGQGNADNSIYNMFYGGGSPRLKMYWKPCGCAIGVDVVPKKTFNADEYMEVAVVRKICIK